MSSLGTGQTLEVAARPASASPAVGYAAKHVVQQKEVIDAALRAAGRTN